MKGTTEKALQEKIDKKRDFPFMSKKKKPTSERRHDDPSGKHV